MSVCSVARENPERHHPLRGDDLVIWRFRPLSVDISFSPVNNPEVINMDDLEKAIEEALQATRELVDAVKARDAKR